MDRETKNTEILIQEAGSVRLRVVLSGLAVGLLALLFSTPPRLQAQAIDLCQGDSNCGKLGDFLNPLTVAVPASSPTDTCDYSTMKIDMKLGVVKVIPVNNAATACVSTAEQSYPLSLVFSGASLPSDFPDGVFEVANFTLQGSQVGVRAARAVTLEFVPNADNTPVWIRATGNLNIQSGNVLSAAGKNGGGVLSTVFGGAGGQGGNGGFRGGDGGNGGVAPTPGTAGFGPGGGAGAAVDAHATDSPEPLTTGKTVAGTVIPASGVDLLTSLRGGSGGGGGGGRSAMGADGGGGGGGAILIAAQSTLTVNGTVTATGGISQRSCSPSCTRHGSGGSGGFIRLVAETIAGTGTITVAGGAGQSCDLSAPCPVAGQAGVGRLEAFNITFDGTLGGNVGAARAPGQIVLPTTPSAFLRIAKITDTSNGANNVLLDTTIAGEQAVSGRTGVLNPVDVTMPNPTTSAATVNVDFTVGPCPAFPAGKHVTLVVAPLDPAQGNGRNYSTDPAHAGFTSGSTAIDCSTTPNASIKNVILPLGISGFSAFAVLSIDAAGALARNFPKMYEGEEIEAVRIQTGKEGEGYVLIAKSGREFPYRPGRGD